MHCLESVPCQKYVVVDWGTFAPLQRRAEEGASGATPLGIQDVGSFKE